MAVRRIIRQGGTNAYSNQGSVRVDFLDKPSEQVRNLIHAADPAEPQAALKRCAFKGCFVLRRFCDESIRSWRMLNPATPFGWISVRVDFPIRSGEIPNPFGWISKSTRFEYDDL